MGGRHTHSIREIPLRSLVGVLGRKTGPSFCSPLRISRTPDKTSTSLADTVPPSLS
jgi:hypothetical protein